MDTDLNAKLDLIRRLGRTPMFVMDEGKMVLVDDYRLFKKYVDNYFNGTVAARTERGQIILVNENDVCNEQRSMQFVDRDLPSDFSMIYRQGTVSILTMSIFSFLEIKTNEDLVKERENVVELVRSALKRE